MNECFLIALYDGEEASACPFRGGDDTCSHLEAINENWGSPLDPEIALAIGLDTSKDGMLHQTRIAELEWQAKRRRCGGMAIEVDPTTQESKSVCPTGIAMNRSKPRRTTLSMIRKVGKAIIRK